MSRTAFLKIFQNFQKLSFLHSLIKVLIRDIDFSVSCIRLNSGRIGIFWEFKSLLPYHRHDYHEKHMRYNNNTIDWHPKSVSFTHILFHFIFFVVLTIDNFFASRKEIWFEMTWYLKRKYSIYLPFTEEVLHTCSKEWLIPYILPNSWENW